MKKNVLLNLFIVVMLLFGVTVLTSIGEEAFIYCGNLKDIKIIDKDNNYISKEIIKSIKDIEIATDHIDPHDNGTFVIKTTYPKIELEKIGKTKYKEFEKEIYSDPDDIIEVDFENNHIDEYLMLNYGLNMLIYTSNEGGFILKA